MTYNFSQDVRYIREILGISQDELAKALGVQRVTISRSELRETEPSDRLLEMIYKYAYEKGVRLNKLKEMFWQEKLKSEHKLLYHGAKGEISGRIDVKKSRINNDFGQGFYTGENYDQAVSFVSGFDSPSLYMIDFLGEGLKSRKYKVDRDWMLTIAYYRGTLDNYKDHPMISKLIKESRNCDYIIAPIADNRMFQIINSFIGGEITDEQCKHCLAATNLGNQYVFISERAVESLQMLERCYLSANERDHYKNIRSADAKLGDDKVKLARIEYRGKGKYIDEILQ
ncbi:MAG: DUF3990 domain-containing protein [Lachnospiraceae bacterium]|nr:DUF3990 domain-containing protein [Lachnospiraceae bacterium]